MLRLFDRFVAEEAHAPLTHHPPRCLRGRLSGFDCRFCLDACLHGALFLEDGRISFARTACTACMRCITVCPNDALVADVDAATLLNGYAEEREMLVTCRRQPPLRVRECSLPCLGLLSAEMLIYYGVYGPPSIYFNVSACAQCVNAAEGAAFIQTLEKVRNRLGSLLSSRLTLLHLNPDEEPSERASRRDFLAGLTVSMRSGTAKAVPPEPVDTRRRVAGRHRLLLKIWSRLDQQKQQLLETTCSPRLAVTSACSFCPRCAGICPSGALQLQREGGVKRLSFDGLRCSSCGLCVAFCKTSALTLTDPPLTASAK